MLNIAHLITHPIQYYAPLYRKITNMGLFRLKVFFENDFSVMSYRDEGFGRSIAWGRDLLEGYDHQFLPAWFPRETNSFFRPLNHGLGRAMREGRFDALWIHGYNRLVHLWAVAQARALGIPVLLRGDTNHFNRARRGPKDDLRSLFLRGLHGACQGFLAVGEANRAHYLANGADPNKIFFAPFSVDHEHLERTVRSSPGRIQDIRNELGLEESRSVILFVGRFSREKGLLDLLSAYRRLADEGPPDTLPHLLMVGDGPLRPTLEADLATSPLPLVRIAGFQDQMALPHYYALSDLLVLPSHLDAWGLVVNESMALGRPVIASHQVGSSYDLIREGITGWTFQAGKVAELATILKTACADRERLQSMGASAREHIQTFSLEATARGLHAAFSAVTSRS